MSETYVTYAERFPFLDRSAKDSQVGNYNNNSDDGDDDDDFLPLKSEFIANRDRAFSWDVNFEEGIHADFVNGHISEVAVTAHTFTSLYVKGNSVIIKDEPHYDVKISTPKVNFNLEGSSLNKVKLVPAIDDIDVVPVLESRGRGLSEANLDDFFGELAPTDFVISDILVKQEPARTASIINDEGFVEPPSKRRLMSREHTSKSISTPDVALSASSSSVMIDGIASPKLSFTTAKNLVSQSLEISSERRVGAYSKEERRVRIERFRQKKMNRIWKKQIKYDCRKRLADTRPRVKGRFVSRSNQDMGGDEEQAQPMLLTNRIKMDDVMQVQGNSICFLKDGYTRFVQNSAESNMPFLKKSANYDDGMKSDSIVQATRKKDF